MNFDGNGTLVLDTPSETRFIEHGVGDLYRVSKYQHRVKQESYGTAIPEAFDVQDSIYDPMTASPRELLAARASHTIAGSELLEARASL